MKQTGYIFLQLFSQMLMQISCPEQFNVQGIGIPLPSPRFTGLPSTLVILTFTYLC